MLQEKIKQLSQQYFEEVRAYRRHLHAHPELSFQEYETAAFVCSKLENFGIPYKKEVAKTGVVGIIEGNNPSHKTIALRADMDALPITETNDIDYKSKNPGVMHACGHDVHTSCLLGAAHILNTLKDAFEGSVKLIFQPSEERSPGGASIMIKEGVLENPRVESILGQHVFTSVPVGKVAYCFGKMMASTDELYITIKGKGGHGAYPHDTKDPVIMAAQFLVAAQQIISRYVNPVEPAVLTFGKITGNGSTNVIPGEVTLEGTIRTFNTDIRNLILEHVNKTGTAICEAAGGKFILEHVAGYPALINDDALTKRSYQRSITYLGKENVMEVTPRMGGEDFSFFAQKIPACFYRLGTGNPFAGITSNIHTPTFNIDENALPIGMGMLAWHAIEELKTN
jgi:amidohydrolase